MKTNIIHYKDIESDLSDNLKIDIAHLSNKMKNKPVSSEEYHNILLRILESIEYRYNTNENIIIFYSKYLIFFSQRNLNF
jgi:hypothetical protein